MAKAKLYALDGTYKSETELPGQLFDQEINEHVMFLAVKAYLANQRQGTAKTKGRSEVSGGGKKPWKQKGTGRARQGSNTAPNFARGGKAHGATPRLYKQELNSKVRKLALKSALSLKAKENSVHIFENLQVTAPKTKELLVILKKAALEGQKNLILVADSDKNLLLAARNIPNLKVDRVLDLNTYEVLHATNAIFTDAAIKALAERG